MLQLGERGLVRSLLLLPLRLAVALLPLAYCVPPLQLHQLALMLACAWVVCPQLPLVRQSAPKDAAVPRAEMAQQAAPLAGHHHLPWPLPPLPLQCSASWVTGDCCPAAVWVQPQPQAAASAAGLQNAQQMLAAAHQVVQWLQLRRAAVRPRLALGWQ